VESNAGYEKSQREGPVLVGEFESFAQLPSWERGRHARNEREARNEIERLIAGSRTAAWWAG